MHQLHQRGFSKSLAVVAVAMVLICLTVYYSLQSPLGKAIEENRVYHPAGFSVIRPADWEAIVAPQLGKREANSLWILPAKAEGRVGEFYVGQRDVPTDEWLKEQQYEKHDFQTSVRTYPAWRKHWRSKRAQHLSYILQIGKQWYEVALQRPLTEPVDLWWKDFLLSIRIDAPVIDPASPATREAGSQAPDVVPTPGPPQVPAAPVPPR
ncbi:MAG: hypothetical protein H7Y43_10500 [Akkermansiaceae bacterium]|nr:hypothetical protein [Verrucomicrobiales bacterium]